MNNVYRTVVVGLGNIAYSYNLNEKFIKEYPVPTHAVAILNNKELAWDTVVDVNQSLLAMAKDELKIPFVVSNVLDVPNRENVEIVVLTCPPTVNKKEMLTAFPNLKGVVIEKPVAINFNEVAQLNSYVNQRRIQAQVAFLRRCDIFLIGLTNGGLEKLIGSPISAHVIYGNGIRNNGSHMVDLVRMLLGEVDEVLGASVSHIKSTLLENDVNISALLRLKTGLEVSFQSIDFDYYRENSLDIWGSKGRIVFNQEGSYYQYWRAKSNRFGEIYKKEIDWVQPDENGKTNLGVAFNKLYSNLLSTIKGDESLCSPLNSAMVTESIIVKMLEKAL